MNTDYRPERTFRSVRFRALGFRGSGLGCMGLGLGLLDGLSFFFLFFFFPPAQAPGLGPRV